MLMQDFKEWKRRVAPLTSRHSDDLSEFAKYYYIWGSDKDPSERELALAYQIYELQECMEGLLDDC